MQITKALTTFICFFITIVSTNGQQSGEVLVKNAEEHRKQKNYDSAVYFYQQAAGQQLKNNQLAGLINSKNQLGIILTRQDKYEQAKTYLDEALNLSVKSGDTNSLTVATTYLALGVVHGAEQRHSLSLENHFKALRIREEKLGPNNSDVATSCGNIGNVYLRKKVLDSSLLFHKRALSIREIVFGKVSDEICQSFINVGNVYLEMKDYDQALAYYNLAIGNKISLKGARHQDVLTLYKRASDIYFLKGDKKNGVEYKSKSI